MRNCAMVGGARWCFRRGIGGVCLIGGIDARWRTLGSESRTDPEWSNVYRSFDAISPWNAGRYRDNASMDGIRKAVWEPDLAELRESGKGYMPTAFPGFSWDNLRRAKPGSPLIARRKGEFYWRQFAIFKELECERFLWGCLTKLTKGPPFSTSRMRRPSESIM